MFVAVVRKYISEKIVVQLVLVAEVVKVANKIRTKGVGCSGCKVCMWQISCTKGVGCSGWKSCQLNM